MCGKVEEGSVQTYLTETTSKLAARREEDYEQRGVK